MTVGQVRGWLDAMRPELGLRDEVADLIVLAWAALRQRAWYQHGSSIPARAGYGPPGHATATRTAAAPADWQAATSRARGPVRDRANPWLPPRRRRLHRKPPWARWTLSLTRRGPVRPGGKAYSHLGLAPTAPAWLATARAGAALVESLRRASSRVHLVESLAQNVGIAIYTIIK